MNQVVKIIETILIINTWNWYANEIYKLSLKFTKFGIAHYASKGEYSSG